jgi:hypothetical protein
MRSELPAPAQDGSWERWGIHGLALEADAYRSGLTHVDDRVHAAVSKAARKAA